jgi:nicotinamidase-related amidase
MTAVPLSRASAAFLLVDHQTGVFERVVKAPPRDQVKANMVRLARVAAMLDLPVAFTTSEKEGPNGALPPTLEEVLPAASASRIDRHRIIAPPVRGRRGAGDRAHGRRTLEPVDETGAGHPRCGDPRGPRDPSTLTAGMPWQRRTAPSRKGAPQ